MSNLYVGIDIAKDTIEVEMMNDAREVAGHATYANNKAGFAQLWRAIDAQGADHVQVCMEATGSYWEGVAYYSYERRATVQVTNPARIKHYARMEGLRQKTDAIDAGVVTRFTVTQRCQAWEPPRPEVRALRSLVRRMDDISLMLQQERNRISSAADRYTRASTAHVEQLLLGEYERLVREFNGILQQVPDVAYDLALLCSIPGVGVRTARRLLVFLLCTPFETARQAAAAVGVTPAHYTSGNRVDRHPHISRMGDAALRRFLFSPAMVAERNNPLIKPWAAGLRKRGLKTKQVRCAVIRKITQLAFGVLKTQTPFDAHFLDRSRSAAEHPTPHATPRTETLRTSTRTSSHVRSAVVRTRARIVRGVLKRQKPRTPDTMNRRNRT